MKFGDGIFVRSERLNYGLENDLLESAVIVEDITDILPPEAPSSFVPHVQDDPSDDVSSSGETESEISVPESDSEVILFWKDVYPQSPYYISEPGI